MAGDTTARFVFRDQPIYSNETTMSRLGVGLISRSGTTTTGSVTGGSVSLYTSGSTATTVALAPRGVSVFPLSPFEVEIRVNLADQQVFEHSGVRVTIIKATPSDLTYALAVVE